MEISLPFFVRQILSIIVQIIFPPHTRTHTHIPFRHGILASQLGSWIIVLCTSVSWAVLCDEMTILRCATLNFVLVRKSLQLRIKTHIFLAKMPCLQKWQIQGRKIILFWLFNLRIDSIFTSEQYHYTFHIFCSKSISPLIKMCWKCRHVNLFSKVFLCQKSAILMENERYAFNLK